MVGIGVGIGAAAQGRMLNEIARKLDFVVKLENPRMVLGSPGDGGVGDSR